MATEMLGKKEDLHESNNFKSEILSVKENIQFTKQWCRDYLKPLTEAKSYKEMMTKKDRKTTIKAIQFLLKDKGYYAGKLDGILSDKTCNSVIKFQKDCGNELKLVDGIPGPETVILLMISDISYERDIVTKLQYEKLCKKSKVTDEELKQMIKFSKKYHLGGVDFGNLREITDSQAKILSEEDQVTLGLTKLTDKQAEELGKVKTHLELPSLKTITDNQAKGLSKPKKNLILTGLTKLSDNQAREFHTHDGKDYNLFINPNILTPYQKTLFKFAEDIEDFKFPWTIK